MKKQSEPFFRRLWRDQRGISLVYAAVMLPISFGFAAITFDVGYAYYVKNRLRNVVEAAALAAAQDIGESCVTPSNCPGKTDATTLSGHYLNINWSTSLTNSTPTLAITGKCLASLVTAGAPCSSTLTAGVPQYNAVSVQASVTAPTFFSQLLGYHSVPLSATAYAGGAGGVPPPLNVMFIVDSTASMNSSDSTCTGGTRILCSLAGVQTLLKTLWPSQDQVGLMTFPGLTSAAYVTDDVTCSGSSIPSAGISPYYAGWGGTSAPIYQLIGSSTTGSTDYRSQTGSTAPANGLNTTTTSLLVQAVGGKTGCAGIIAKGGSGTFYADIITAAETTLTAWNTHIVNNGGTARQNVIIFLSDGDANANNSSQTQNICCSAAAPGTGQTAKINFQCHEAVTAAQAAAAAPVSPNTTKTWVYSVAYGSATSGSCSTDNSPIKVPGTASAPAAQPYQACNVMTNVASDPTKFYSDNANGCASTAHPSITTLSAIFADIGASLGHARLISSGLFAGPTD